MEELIKEIETELEQLLNDEQQATTVGVASAKHIKHNSKFYNAALNVVLTSMTQGEVIFHIHSLMSTALFAGYQLGVKMQKSIPLVELNYKPIPKEQIN